jgi:hypothetical protein
MVTPILANQMLVVYFDQLRNTQQMLYIAVVKSEINLSYQNSVCFIKVENWDISSSVGIKISLFPTSIGSFLSLHPL